MCGSFDTKPRSGKPRKISATADRRIVRFTKKNPHVTSTETGGCSGKRRCGCFKEHNMTVLEQKWAAWSGCQKEAFTPAMPQKCCRTKLRGAERKWCKSKDPSDLSKYQYLLSSFSAEVHTAKSSYFHKINSAPDTRNLFRTFNYLLCPPPPRPITSITADDFATFFTEKTRTISSQFSPPHTQDLQQTTSTAQTPIFSFCPLTEAEVSRLPLSSHPTTCPLDPIPSHLLQAISPALLPALTHIINTSLLTGIFPNAFK